MNFKKRPRPGEPSSSPHGMTSLFTFACPDKCRIVLERSTHFSRWTFNRIILPKTMFRFGSNGNGSSSLYLSEFSAPAVIFFRPANVCRQLSRQTISALRKPIFLCHFFFLPKPSPLASHSLGKWLPILDPAVRIGFYLFRFLLLYGSVNLHIKRICFVS